METREQRGLVIAAKNRIQNQGRHWLVPSQTEVSKKYKVIADDGCSHCNCPDHELTGQVCKHIYAVRFVIQRELFDDGTEVETRQVIITEKRKTYPQNWSVYNACQTEEKTVFQKLLFDLCKSIPEPTEARLGRPRLSLRDSMFCAAYKVYSLVSSRRFTSDLCDAHAKGCISRVPHFNSVLNVFDAPETESLLMGLVAKSAEPLAAVETNFAIDATGFSGCRFDCWFEHKWKDTEPRSVRAWVKAHAVVGTTTSVVAAVEVTHKDQNDGTMLRTLMQQTATRFSINDLCADKAYLTEANLQAIADIGANAFIPFKKNSAATRPGVWNNAYHFFNLHREEFLERYHRRSIAETAFSSLKRKFGDSVRAKTERTMRTEVLAKFLCHNLTTLAAAMREFNIDPTFTCTKTPELAQNLRRAGE